MWHLVFWGVLTTLVLIQPDFIVLGYLLLVIPGLILNFAPSVFFYSLVITILVFLLRPVGRVRFWLSPALVAVVSFSIPFTFNQPTFDKARELTQNDVEVTNPIEITGTLALLKAARYGQGRECNSLCLRLLYDGRAERVLVGHYRSRDGDSFTDPDVTAYFLEKRDFCPAAPVVLDTVSQRMASGDCLVSDEAKLEDAEVLYVTGPVSQAASHGRYVLTHRFRIEVAAVSAVRKQIIQKTEAGYETLYQKTQTTAEPLSYPLFLGGIMHGGGSLDISLGFLRDREVTNSLQHFEREDELRIFGVKLDSVATPVKETAEDARALVLRALSHDGPDVQAGHDFFRHYLESFSHRKQDWTPVQADVEVVLKALKDERITNGFWGLGTFYRKLDSPPDALIEAMVDRILNQPEQKYVVEALSKVIGGLPEGKAAVISAQLLEILENEQLNRAAWRAVARLGDGDPRAVEHYLSKLQAWRGGDTPMSRQIQFETWRGSLVGLCRLGRNALAAKEDLLKILRRDDNVQVTWLVIEALINMGVSKGLKEEFQETQLWPVISHSILNAKRHASGSPEICR